MATTNLAVAVFHIWGTPTVAPEPQREVLTAAELGPRRRARPGAGLLVQLSSERLEVPEGAVAVVQVGGGTRIAAESAQVRLNLTLTRHGGFDVVEEALRATTSHHNVLAVPLAGQQLSPLPPTAVGG